MSIKTKVTKFLRGIDVKPRKLKTKVVNEFTSACKEAIQRQISEARTGFKIRASGLGRPVCQQQFEKLGTEGESKGDFFRVMMLMGDMVEATTIAILRESGVQIDDVHGEVELDIGGHRITGTYDIVIDGLLYDIKSCSPWAYENKFSKGFHALASHDPFGYVTQLFLYAQASGYPPGGWIAVNKVTGEMCVCKVPKDYTGIMHSVITKTMDTLDILEHTKSEADIQRQFDLVDETYRRKPTGKKILGTECNFCPFKHTCWNNKLKMGTNPLSTAKNPNERLEYDETREENNEEDSEQLRATK